ncbi:putative phage tail protein [Methylobacter sp. Wu1]|uniref:YmfQ family protein n=1 Tax=Methylobacter sp. Wu1 TaxID=3119359 RepID=UPI002F92D7BA
MGLSVDDYLSQLQALLPQGGAWPRNSGTVQARLLAALAEEFARVDARIEALFDEADPRTTTELLPDWERVAGLPDDCVGQPASINERRAMLVARITNIGGQSRQFFINLAQQLGYAITITEFTPYSVNSHVNDPLYGQLWVFVWRINAAQDTVRRFTVTGQVSDPLASWGNEILECALSRLSPAHTLVQFAYI